MDRKRSADVSHIPLDRHIQKHRETLVRQKDALPAMHARLAELRGIAEHAPTRRALRRQRDADEAAAVLQTKIDDLESDSHIRNFEQRIVPFMEAYTRHSNAPARKLSRVAVPGEVATRAVEAGSTQTKTDVVAEYLTVVQGEPPRARIERDDTCPRCSVAMVLVPSRALLACQRCGHSSTFLDATSSSISYDDSVEMVTFSYKRGNHFQDWLNNVQGLEAYDVPQDIIDSVMHELYRQRVTDVDQITTRRVRDVLKSLKLRRAYEHVAKITSTITGRDPPRLPPEAAELCRLMFTAVQIPFQKYCPPSRKNFLSYSFILSKMLYILGYDELCETLTLLKGKDKLQKMDQVWKDITRDLDWEYFPSV